MTTASFAQWLEQRGASDNTVRQYTCLVRPLVAAGPDAIQRAVELLSSRTRAPKSRRLMRTAYKSWARFTGNRDLLDRVDEVRLPPARRVKAQVPLPDWAYNEVRREIAEAGYIDDGVRGCLGLVANRGFRRADVLHLRRTEVVAGLRQGVLAYVMKGAKRVEIGILPTFRPALEQLASYDKWNRAYELVSSSWDGAEKALPRALRAVAEALDERGQLGDVAIEDVRMHVLRRTYAAKYYVACGRDPVKLQKHLGWDSVVTALSYVDYVTREDLDSIAETMFDPAP